MLLGDLDIAQEDANWAKTCPDYAALIEKAVTAALNECQTQTHGRPAELSVVLADNGQVHELNREYRAKDKPTNILSFPALEHEGAGQVVLEPGPVHLGDIVLAFGVVEREARELKIPFEDHLMHLVVHGVLHLIGFDHMDDLEAEAMESAEIRILAQFGVANPYGSEAES